MNETVPARRVTLAAVVGAVLLLLLFIVGFAARSAGWTAVDLGIDRAAAAQRTAAGTPVFLALTGAAAEPVGLTLLAVGVVVLLLRSRRVEALRLLVMAGASWVLAIGVKDVIDRPRPPSSLWLLKPDPTGSFPSGHDTTASVIAVIILMALAGTGAARGWLTTAALAFALAVGISRIYLGDHYPTDVLGSYLAVGAASLLVWAAFEITAVRRVTTRLLHEPTADRTVASSRTVTGRQATGQ